MSKPIHFKTYVYQELDGSPGGVCVPHETYLELLAEYDTLAAENEKLQRLNANMRLDLEWPLVKERDALAAANAELVEALEYVFGSIQNEMVSQGLPLEGSPSSGYMVAKQALAKHGGGK